MNAYVYPNYFGNIKAMSIASLAGTVVILALSTFIVKVASKIGKKELSMIGCFISAASFILLFIIHTHNVLVWVGLIIVATIGTSMFNMVIWAMITDVIDESVRMEQFIQYIHLQESLDRLVHQVYQECFFQ